MLLRKEPGIGSFASVWTIALRSAGVWTRVCHSRVLGSEVIPASNRTRRDHVRGVNWRLLFIRCKQDSTQNSQSTSVSITDHITSQSASSIFVCASDHVAGRRPYLAIILPKQGGGDDVLGAHPELVGCKQVRRKILGYF